MGRTCDDLSILAGALSRSSESGDEMRVSNYLIGRVAAILERKGAILDA
jgi:hypothetical protein